MSEIKSLQRLVLLAVAAVSMVASLFFCFGGFSSSGFLPTFTLDSSVLGAGMMGGVDRVLQTIGAGSLGALPDPLSLLALVLFVALGLGNSRASGFLLGTLGLLGLLASVPLFLYVSREGGGLAAVGSLLLMPVGLLGQGFSFKPLAYEAVASTKPSLLRKITGFPTAVLGKTVMFCEVRQPIAMARITNILLWILVGKIGAVLLGIVWFLLIPLAFFAVIWAVIIVVAFYVGMWVLAQMADKRSPEEKAADEAAAKAQKAADKEAEKLAKEEAREALKHNLMKIDRSLEELPDRQEIYDSDGQLLGTRVKKGNWSFDVLDDQGKLLGTAKVDYKEKGLLQGPYDEIWVYDAAKKRTEFGGAENPLYNFQIWQDGEKRIVEKDPGFLGLGATRVSETTTELEVDKEGVFVRESNKITGESVIHKDVEETWGKQAHRKTTTEVKK